MDSLSPRQKLFSALAAIHLLLVGLFIWTPFPGTAEHAVPSALRTYKNLSGCFRDYSFFAPLVASDLRAGFHLGYPDSTSRFISFAAPNKEIGFRYNCIIASCMRDARGRDLFTQSWAANILGFYPEASVVRIVTEAYEVPDMEAFRTGKRPEWTLVYFGDYERE